MQLLEIQDKQHLDTVIHDNQYVLVDFSAPWCGPCKALLPVLEQISEKYDQMLFVKVDIEKCPELAHQHNIRAVPSMLIFKNNEKVATKTGMVMRDVLEKWIGEML